MKVTVKSEFRDISSFKTIHKVGDVLEVEKERGYSLISRGLVEAKEKKAEDKPICITLFEKEFEKKALVEALKAIGEKVTMNMKEETLLENVTALGEEKTSALKEALGIK